MPFVISRRFFRTVAGLSLAVAVCFTVAISSFAEDATPSLASILARKHRETYDAVVAYVTENPSAADSDRAFRFLFETARREGWEGDALPMVELYRKRPEPDAVTRALATQVQALGLARTGKGELALDLMDESLAGVGLRMANDSLDFATALAGAVQTSGQPEHAKSVYERLSRRFFLNAGVRQFCENRLGKLELLGKTAPDFTIEDTEGKAVNWSDYAGKLVLVDFWATNCPPCLEEFPSLKQLHADYHKEGFEVVGISLDDDRAVVEAFQDRAKLPWRLALSKTDRDATRERFRVVTIPSMFLVDGEGKILHVDVRGEELRRAVGKALRRSR